MIRESKFDSAKSFSPHVQPAQPLDRYVYVFSFRVYEGTSYSIKKLRYCINKNMFVGVFVNFLKDTKVLRVRMLRRI